MPGQRIAPSAAEKEFLILEYLRERTRLWEAALLRVSASIFRCARGTRRQSAFRGPPRGSYCAMASGQRVRP